MAKTKKEEQYTQIFDDAYKDVVIEIKTNTNPKLPGLRLKSDKKQSVWEWLKNKVVPA